MGALRNPLSELPGPPKKPIRREVKLNRYGRDPNSPAEKLRVSDYEKDTGYSPLFHSFLADWPRISRGHAADILMMVVLAKSLGRSVKKGAPREQSTQALSLQELSELCRCDIRTIQRELADFEARGIARVDKAGNAFIVTLLYREWESLPDYNPKVVPISEAQESEEEQTEEEQAKNTERTRITRKPIRITGGHSSKPMPVSCGVRSFRYQLEAGPVDLEFEAVVQAGELLVTSKVSQEWLKRWQNENGRSNQINYLIEKSRHGCRDNVNDPPAKPPAPVHPRAQEISDLFDPLLKKWQSRLISTDPQALQAACEAIGETDRNFLIHFLMAGSDPRAARNISGPKAVIGICKEAHANWKKHPEVPTAPVTAKPKARNFSDDVQNAMRERIQKWGKL